MNPSYNIILPLHFLNQAKVHAYKEQFDPLHRILGARVDLLYPFTLQGSEEELVEYLREENKSRKAFHLLFREFRMTSECQVYFQIIRGREKLEIMHHALITGKCQEYWDRRYLFVPSCLVGRATSVKKAKAILNKLQGDQNTYKAVVKEVQLIQIQGNNPVKVVARIPFQV